MIDIRGPYTAGGTFVSVSAALHLAAPVLGGFQGTALVMAGIGLFYIALAWGLFEGWRWLAYIAFLCMIIGGIGALSNIWALGPVPGWLFTAIALADLAALVALFIALWRPARSAEA